jgi:hypothetical protein
LEIAAAWVEEHQHLKPHELAGQLLGQYPSLTDEQIAGMLA